MDVLITTGDTTLHATLNDSAAAQDFAAMLPLTLTLGDHANTEKVADLPGQLSTTGSPSGTAARAGDITYFAPWGNLAIFYRDFDHANGLIALGRIHDPLDVLTQSAEGPTITITQAE